MKTISLSDDDYNTLMELSKELQTQENHCQAFPYFWEPASEKLVIDPNNEGEVVEIYDEKDCETVDAEDYAENNPELYADFLEDEGYELPDGVFDTGDLEYKKDIEREWCHHVDNYATDTRVYSSNWESSSDHNPSLFLSDIQQYIKNNRHKLGRNPRTYARTFNRMPKMESLVGVLYRLNKQPIETVNEEARRFVHEKPADKTESKPNKSERISPEQTFAKLFTIQAGAFALAVILLLSAFWGFGFIIEKIWL